MGVNDATNIEKGLKVEKTSPICNNCGCMGQGNQKVSKLNNELFNYSVFFFGASQC